MSKAYRMTEAEAAAHQRRVRGSVQQSDSVKRPSVQKAKSVNRKGRSELEMMFRAQLVSAGVRLPVMQYEPFLDRSFRLDFAWPIIPSDPHLEWEPAIAIEVQGMAHRIKERFKADCRRHNALVQAGWTVYYVTGDMIRDGTAIELAKQVLRK